MNADQLLAHYEKIADAPDAIDRLRRFILDLAVRGKLVEQDPVDEPAAELYQQLAESYKTTKQPARRGRRTEASGIISEPPFELPELWTWVHMGEIGDTNIGLTYSPANVGEKGVPVLRSNNVQNGKIDLSNLVRVDVQPKASVMVAQGDMLICARNGSRSLVGKAAIINDLFEPMAFGAFMAIFRSPLNPYLHLFLSSPVFRQVIDEVNTNTINQITQANLRSTLTPLPPLAEQQRIVAKVDALMALCDRLEAARAEREATRDRLAAASLARLNAPDLDPAAFQTHAAFVLDNLAPLTTRPDQIKAIRQNILNLAVRGKLVEQDPADEPASELLKKILAKKSHQVAAGKMRAQTPLEPVSPDECEFLLPPGWGWSRLGEVVKLWNGFAFKSSDFGNDGEPVIRIGDLQDGIVDLSNAKRVPSKIAASVGEEIWIPENALLLAMSGATTGKTAFNLTGQKLLLNQRVGRIAPFLMNIQFIRFFFETIVARNLNISLGTAIPNLSAKQINETAIPLPPLAEQHRIVAKVDELMALCDRLEAALATADTTRQRLLEALLHEALMPGEEQEAAA